ncbi:hypothetical protein J1N35_044329 [Gossypium stocksii]|uniref:Uncharacterized protein n=1 Tax=Gossypium stocksii TaxID=47602 RepID=A0A9D3U9A0_9ROSI|nr:hypothetical protein J1N35_044329 [Gossypium stocksii]
MLGQQFYQWDRARNREKKKSWIGLEEKLNNFYEQEPTNEILVEIIDIQLRLNLEADQEVYWEQQARINWLKNYDRNTRFFHKVLEQRHIKGRINGLEGDDGRWASTIEEILQLAVKYFGNFFSASEEDTDDRLLGIVERRIFTDMNVELLK